MALQKKNTDNVKKVSVKFKTRQTPCCLVVMGNRNKKVVSVLVLLEVFEDHMLYEQSLRGLRITLWSEGPRKINQMKEEVQEEMEKTEREPRRERK